MQKPRTYPQGVEVAALPNALLNPKTTCAVVGLSLATIRRRLATRDFPEPVKLGPRALRWRSSDIAAWVAAQTQRVATAPTAKADPIPIKRKKGAHEVEA